MPDFTQFSKEDFLAEESFANYLLQKNANDIQFWEGWIKENPKCEHEIKEARLLFFLLRDQKHASDNSKINVELDNQYSKFQSLLEENNSQIDDIILFPKEKNIPGKSLFRRMIWQSGAVAAVFLIAFLLWKNLSPVNNPLSKDQYALFAKTDSLSKEVALPDGSIVQLNNYSTIEIAKNYNSKKREVLLTGSAFFKVYKNHSKPFIVSSGSIKTTALGTAFYIYNLHPQSFSVSLLEGMVKVEGDKNSVQLLPGEKAIYNYGERLVKDSFNLEQLQNFAKGKIQFEHAGLHEIKTILEEYFNKEVVIEGNAPNINFTGNFDSKKIETILEALQFTYNIKYKSEGQKVIISFN